MDIETNGLLQECTRTWIVGFKNIDTGEVKMWLHDDTGWIKEFEKVTVFIGHNELGFDFAALEKIHGYKPRSDQRMHDTLILSQVLNYRRFGNDGHSLERWGEFLNKPKGAFDEFKPKEGESVEDYWGRVGKQMIIYWKQDLEVTEGVHVVVMKEYQAIKQTNPKITMYLRAENAVATWCAQAELRGWPFDVRTAQTLFEKMEVELNIARDKITPVLGMKIVAKDKENGVVKCKEPKWVKSGAYAAHVANWFGIDEYSGQDEDRLVEGPYTRIEIKDLDLDSVSDVKIFLYRNNWVPTEYNIKHEPDPDKPGRFIKVKTSPKITLDSLECMHGDGKLYCDFLTTRSRYGILKTWLENVDKDGNLHGSCMTIGTPSMRLRHNIIVNVPSTDSAWGEEMRSLFTARPGWKLIGTDSAGNQARGLAHYLKSPEFTDQLLNGDIHTFNANVIDAVLMDMKISWSQYLLSTGVKADVYDPDKPDKKLLTLEEAIAKAMRARAKRILYAFLFGASGGKLWSYLFDKIDDTKGKKFKAGFTRAVPGFEKLLDKLNNIYGKTKQYSDGYIPGLGGNKIYCDSFHKLLVYLLQACEKVTCSAALMLTMENLEKEGIPYQPCIFMHDEIDFLVPEEYAERAAVTSKETFKEGPKLFGVTIMDGEAKIGDNWYEVH